MIESHCIAHKLLNRIERLPLTLNPPITFTDCGVSPMWPATGISASIIVVDQVSPYFFAAFNFHGFRSRFFDEASSIADCFIRSGVIRAIRHVGDQERMLDSARTALLWCSISSIVTERVFSLAEHGLGE